MDALLRHQNNAQCIHKTVLCVTDKKDAGGIQYAEQHDVPVLIETLDTSLPRDERRREHEQRITKQLDEADIDLIVLSGYMRLLSPDFVEKYFPRIINIHPSLLPAFPGKDAHTDVLASGVRVKWLHRACCRCRNGHWPDTRSATSACFSNRFTIPTCKTCSS